MTGRLKKPCVTQGCPNLVTVGARCGPCIKKYRAGFSVDNKRFYDSGLWQRTRRAVLVKSPLCCVCGVIATEVDHIKPIAQGGSKLDLNNLQGLCKRCHSRKTATETILL